MQQRRRSRTSDGAVRLAAQERPASMVSAARHVALSGSPPSSRSSPMRRTRVTSGFERRATISICPVVLSCRRPTMLRSIELRTETSVYVLRADSKEVAEDWILSLGLAACARRRVALSSLLRPPPPMRSRSPPPPLPPTAPTARSARAMLCATSSTATARADDNNASRPSTLLVCRRSRSRRCNGVERALAARRGALRRADALQLTADPLRAFARYANVHSSTSDADVGALFGCATGRRARAARRASSSRCSTISWCCLRRRRRTAVAVARCRRPTSTCSAAASSTACWRSA
jgi:hypothetical protein